MICSVCSLFIYFLGLNAGGTWLVFIPHKERGGVSGELPPEVETTRLKMVFGVGLKSDSRPAAV